jgi:hypothetical protein
MTRSEAEDYIHHCEEDDGPSSYEEAAEIFAAVFGRAPEPDDGDQGDLFSHAVAVVDGSEWQSRAARASVLQMSFTLDEADALLRALEIAPDYQGRTSQASVALMRQLAARVRGLVQAAERRRDIELTLAVEETRRKEGREPRAPARKTKPPSRSSSHRERLGGSIADVKAEKERVQL